MKSLLEAYSARGGIRVLRRFFRVALFILFCCLVPWCSAHSASVTLAWDPSPTPNLTGYLIRYGMTTKRYSQQRLVSTNQCRATIENLAPGRTYYFVVAARTTGAESLPSNEASGVPPPPPTATMTVRTRGDGIVTPNLDGEALVIGTDYKVTALPGGGSLFTGWTGGATSSAHTLTFAMASNLVLTANFVASPYPPLAGNYNGLFYETAGVRPDRSGFLALTATALGAYSGKVILSGRTHGFTGRLNINGKATNVISRPNIQPLTLELDCNNAAAADQLTGRLTDGTWSAPLLGDRAPFDSKTNRAPFAGSYTLVVPGAHEGDAGPQGDGFAVLTVDGRGGVAFVGTLADGSKASQKVFLSENGVWPLYLALYRGQGAVLGWQTIGNLPRADITGLLSWIRPQQLDSKYWPAGFTNDTRTLGSVYTAPALTAPVLDFTQFDFIITGGNFSTEFKSPITFDARNKVHAEEPGALSMTLTLKSGLFTGKVVEPVSKKKLSFKGAILQKQNGGAGFLLGTNRSARVSFGL